MKRIDFYSAVTLAFLFAASLPAQLSKVAVRVQPPKPGFSLSLTVTCTSMDAWCQRLSEPTKITLKKFKDGRCVDVKFTPLPDTGLNITLTIKGETLEPGDRVDVMVHDPEHPGDQSKNEHLNIEFVRPADADIECCLIGGGDGSPQFVQASIPLEAPVQMHVRRANGALKSVLGIAGEVSSSDKALLTFRIPASFSLDPGDLLSFSESIEGTRTVLKTFTIPSSAPPPNQDMAPQPDPRQRPGREYRGFPPPPPPPHQGSQPPMPSTDTAGPAPMYANPPAPSYPGAMAPVPPPPQFCANPYFDSPPGQTDSVTVTLGCLPASPNDLAFLVDGAQQNVVWSQTGTSPIKYTAKLSTKLQAGQAVKVYQWGQHDPDSVAQIVTGPVQPPKTILAVTEGATSVTGFAPGLDKVRVQVLDGNYVRDQVEGAVDSSTNKFSATFTNPVQADEQLKVFGVSKGVQSESSTPGDVLPTSLDWGRVRAYFTAGVLLSNNNSQFNLTSANTFVDFNIDKDWARPVASLNSSDWWGKERFRFHTYFDARLTAIPTSTMTSTSSTTPTLSSGSTGSTGSTGGTSTTGSTPNPSPAALLTNSQAAALQIGAYLPIVISNWTFNTRPYSLFVAPIAKGGFYTLTSAGSTANQAAEGVGHNSRFFPFYGYGVRFGHYREYTTWDGRADGNKAPQLLSYLDFTVSKWANFEYIAPYNFGLTANPMCDVPASDPTTAGCLQRERLWRYSFEGLLIVPNTPLVIGFSANVAAQHPRMPNFIAPPDDLRFLFGVRFDASKLTNVLGKLGGQ